MKTNINTLMFVLLIMIHTIAYGAYIDLPTKEASELAKYYAMTDDDGKNVYLDKLNDLSLNNPNNTNVTRIYLSILSSRGKYKKAISVLNKFNKNNNNEPLMLQECMLKDRVGVYDSSCYEKVISIMKSEGIKNIDYLMALFLTNNKDFDKEKEWYIKNTNNKQDLDVFNYKRNDLLENLYP